MLWVAVTADEYELPIAVARTGEELARMLGITKQSLYRAYSQHRNGTIKNWKNYKIVKVSDEE